MNPLRPNQCKRKPRITTELANGGWKNCRLPYTQSSDTTYAFMTSVGTTRAVDSLYTVNGNGFFNDYGAVNTDSALIIVTPITVLGPGLALASLVVGLNLFTEGLARILGRTVKLGAQ